MPLTLGMCKNKQLKTREPVVTKKKKKWISPLSDLNDYVCKGKLRDVDLKSVMESK